MNLKNYLIILIASLVLVTIPNYIFTVGDINRDREGCERLNTNREVQYKYLIQDKDLRERTLKNQKLNISILKELNLSPKTLKSTLAQTKISIKANREFLSNDKEALINLKKSAAQYHVPHTHVVSVDCESAYPYPFSI